MAWARAWQLLLSVVGLTEVVKLVANWLTIITATPKRAIPNRASMSVTPREFLRKILGETVNVHLPTISISIDDKFSTSQRIHGPVQNRTNLRRAISHFDTDSENSEDVTSSGDREVKTNFRTNSFSDFQMTESIK